MNRRKLLKDIGLAAAATAVSAPAIAQSAPTLRWRLTTSFPKSLDTLYGACEMFSKAIGDLSEKKFQISVFGPGEIVPAFQVFDAWQITLSKWEIAPTTITSARIWRSRSGRPFPSASIRGR